MTWKFDILAGPFNHVTEGPAWDGTGLLFTSIRESLILRYDPATSKTSIYRKDTNYANGLMFDKDGLLYACEGGERRMVQYHSNGDTTVLADSYEGKRFNIPNDLAIDNYSRIWFTDPYYEGAAGPWSEDRSNKELDHDSVYCLVPSENGTYSCSRVTFDTTRPNGLLFSLDHKILYVAQSGRNQDELRQLRAYPVNDDGSLAEMSMLHDFGAHRGIDGMCLNTDGNIVATAGVRSGGPGPSIYIFSPDGDVIDRHEVPVDRPTNCTFGGPDLSTLYVTSFEGYLMKVETNMQGRLAYPQVT